MLFLIEFCETKSVLMVIYFLKSLVNIIKVVIPILLIVMTSIDIFKNVISNREEDMRKNVNLALKRVMMAVIIFFIPTIVSLVNDIVNESVSVEFDYNACLVNADNYEDYEDITFTYTSNSLTDDFENPENPYDSVSDDNTSSGSSSCAQAMVDEAKSHLGENGDASYALFGCTCTTCAGWCAAFVEYVANNLGLRGDVVLKMSANPRNAKSLYSPLNQWHSKDGYTPKTGDLILFDYGNDGVSEHIGIVEYVDDTYVYYIDGNTGSSKGQCYTVVSEHSLKLDHRYIYGYASPDYPDNC